MEVAMDVTVDSATAEVVITWGASAQTLQESADLQS
jgi:hypothetical protein